MIDYEQIRREASVSIREAGTTMTLRVLTGGEVDHGGEAGQQEATEYPAFGVKRYYREHEIDNTLVLQGDLKVILEVSSTMPRPGAKRDKLIIDGEAWDIENCEPLAPGDTTVLYKVQARR